MDPALSSQLRSDDTNEIGVRRRTLELLYEASKNPSVGQLSLERISQHLDVPLPIARFHLDYLADKGWVILNRNSRGAQIVHYYTIAPDGVDLVEDPSKFDRELPVVQQIYGDIITVGDIRDSHGVALGRDARATAIRQASNAEKASSALEELRQMLGPRMDTPRTQVAALALNGLEEQVQKGEYADAEVVREWFTILRMVVPHIGKVTVDTFARLIGEVNPVFQKIAREARESQQPR